MLSEKQEEYVVKTVKIYSKEIDEAKKSISIRIFRIGIGAIGAVLMATKAQDWAMSDWASIPILASSIYFAIHNAGYLISNIIGKTGLSIRMLELVEQAQLMDYSDKEEKNKGKGK